MQGFKDVHLIEAAFAAGLRVAALDEAVRACFRLACVSVPRLRSVCWINPANPQENPLGWLQTGAPLDGFRLLGYDAGEE